MHRCLLLSTLLAVALTSASGCRRSGAQSASLTVAGSTSVQPFVEKWAEVYSQKHPGAQINVQGGGSTAGVKAARTGAAQIGTVSRELKPEEKGLNEIVVARDGIAVIVNPANPVTSLTLDQVKSIFTGAATNWKDLGGRDQPITSITREEGSGTRGAFEELVLKGGKIVARALVQDSTGAVREMVHSDASAIGYISLGQLNDQIKALQLGGVEATEEHVAAGTYPLVRPFLFVTQGTVDVTTREFLAFVLSPEGQALVRTEGLIPAK